MSDFKYTTAIKRIRKVKSRIKIIQGGTSAGKTFAIIPILIDMAARDKILISIVSESMPHLRKGAMRDFLNIMKMTNRYIDEHWNRTNSIYTFHNGSQIEFFPADSADKLRGSRRNVLFVNECNNVHYEAYQQLAMRTDKEVFLDYNPSHKFWVDEVLLSDEAERIILTYRDNEALSPTIIKFLEDKRELALTSEYWANWCKVYLDGQLGRLEGTIFQNWMEIDSLPEEARLIGYGLDFGYTNDPTAVIGVYKLDDKLVLDEKVYMKELTNSQIGRELTNCGVLPNDEIFGDSAEPKSIREIRMLGFRNIQPVKKGSDSIMYGIGIMQEQEFLITRRSQNLIEEFNKYRWKTDKNGDTLNTPIDNFNHGIDAIRYCLMMKLGIKKNSGVHMKIIKGY